MSPSESGWDGYAHYVMDLAGFDTVATFLAESDDTMGGHTNLSLPVALDVYMKEELVAGADEFGCVLADVLSPSTGMAQAYGTEHWTSWLEVANAGGLVHGLNWRRLGGGGGRSTATAVGSFSND